MTGFRLRDGLHHCRCGTRIVLLDLAADRYFELSFEVARAFAAVCDAEPGRTPSDALDLLARRGLVVRDPEGRGIAAAASIEAPHRDIVRETAASASPGEIAGALAAQAWLALVLRALPFACALRLVRRGRRPAAPDAVARARALRLALAHDATGLVLRAQDRCLVRALALYAGCCRRGVPAALVFGVRLDPFSAHCWVQHGADVLVGDVEQVRLHVPILVVR